MMKIKNIERAAKRILKAVKKKEQIIIFGDSDLDGVASTVILEEAVNSLISSLGREERAKTPKVKVYFPDRRNEGYGLNEKALKFLKSEINPPALLITLDCGISNFKEIKEAKEFGFNVIVADHHKPLDKLPQADIVVDPKQEGDDYPFKEFSNAGLSFKLAEELLDMPQILKDSFLELVALATISDMMPEIDENKDYIIKGLSKIEKSQRPGIQIFFNLLNMDDFNSKREMIAKMISAFNAAWIQDHITNSYKLLRSFDNYEVEIISKELLDESKRRLEEILALTENVKQTIEQNPFSPIIFEGSKTWRIEYLGSVASRLVKYFSKPVFLYKKNEKISRGTVRVPGKYDAVKAMSTCADLLEVYGGHAPAAGFTVKNDNLEEFKNGLVKYFTLN